MPRIVFVVKWDSSIQKRRCPSTVLLKISFARLRLNSAFTSSEGERPWRGLPGFLYVLFSLCIVLYAVLGETLSMENRLEIMIRISLPVQTLDFIPHPPGCLSMDSDIFEWIFWLNLSWPSGLGLVRACIKTAQVHAVQPVVNGTGPARAACLRSIPHLLPHASTCRQAVC